MAKTRGGKKYFYSLGQKAKAENIWQNYRQGAIYHGLRDNLPMWCWMAFENGWYGW